MFDKILIANRGEIACRVIKTAKKMGVSTVAVYSDADRNSMHVKMADEAVYIGASPATESYLDIEKIIKAAKKTAAQAIHPGYGFLSENADFCQRCADNNLVFIGPPAVAIEKMGSKSAAKSIMGDANVPLVPGYHGEDQSADVIKDHADNIGYPVLLKAVAGGGGKGMRVVESGEGFSRALTQAKREAASSFGSDAMLVEKYLPTSRHVEIQVFFDSHGNGVYLYDRDCSIQRRHQKIIEEAPAPGLSDALRKAMGEAALRAAQAIDYVSAGTVEFLLADAEKQLFYFMEMNTRLQVEHPVTEMITGFDLVDWQLRIASGEKLPVAQDDISINGHAFEARIYAEDPDQNFCPSTGLLTHLKTPRENEHVRVDTGVEQHDEVTVFYDPMIAKLISWDADRKGAALILRKSLEEFQVAGVKTNIQLIHRIFSSQDFLTANIDTRFIDKHQENILQVQQGANTENVLLAALYLLCRRRQRGVSQESRWSVLDSWRLNQAKTHKGVISVEGIVYTLSALELSRAENVKAPPHYRIEIDGCTYTLSGELNAGLLIAEIDGLKTSASVVDHNDIESTLITKTGNVDFSLDLPTLGDDNKGDTNGRCVAPMNGRVIDVLVTAGQTVEKNSPLIVMEAMKMEHTVEAPVSGVIENVLCQEGDLVDGGSDLVTLSIAE